MTLFNRLKYPQTETDWSLGRNVPDFARRLAISSLRGLLSYLTYGPIWLGQPTDLENLKNPDRLLDWPVATTLAPIFRKALPSTFEKLGWERDVPQATLRYRDALAILALGYRELFATHTDNRQQQSWPAGLDQERWLDRIRTGAPEFRPMAGLIDFWEKELQQWVPTLLVHGSCATLDHVSGVSDLDTLMVISQETLCDPDKLAAFVSKFQKSHRYLFEFNPYMHHGHMLATELDLGELSEASLPLCLAENGITFGKRLELALHPDSDLETHFALQSFETFFERTITTAGDIKTSFDLLWWASSAIFIPVLFMQVHDRMSRWKPEALEAARNHLTPEELDLIDYLTQLRSRMGVCFPPLLPYIAATLSDSDNPGLMIKRQKEATPLAPAQLTGLGVDSRRIMQARAMFQRLSSLVAKLFLDRYADDSLLKSCITAFAGKTIAECPSPIDGAMYEATRDWIISQAKSSDEVRAIYQYGEVGCPGLSDLDMLVVLKDGASRPTPFALSDLPPLLQDVMGHDATFISSDSLTVFPKVFPLFGARLVYGTGAYNIAASFSDWKSILPTYTITFLAKYPADLIYLCRLSTIRFKTILAFLHSFKHFIPLYELLGSVVPSAVTEAVNRDEIIRRDFAAGKMPLASELPEIMELMFRATAAVAKSLDEAWAAVAPHLPVLDAPLRFDTMGTEFRSGWTEDVLQRYCAGRLSVAASGFVPFPARLGWFVYWLSLGKGIVSRTIAENLSQRDLDATGTGIGLSSAFKAFAPFRNDLNTFAEIESRNGRFVSKYIALIDIAPITVAVSSEEKKSSRYDLRYESNAIFSMPSVIKKILIPRFDTLGDIVLLEGLIATILRQFPDAELTMLVREGYDQLTPLFPSRLEWRTTSLYPFKGPEETDLPIIAALLEDISNDSWDLVLFTTYNRTWIDEVLAAQLTCAPRIALGEAYVPQDWLKTLLESLELNTENPYVRIVPVEEKSRETEKYQIFWDALFPVKEKLPLPHLNVPQDAEHAAAAILAQLGLDAEMFFVCVPAGTQNISIKKWPAERFAEVIAWVDQTYGFHPLLIGHESEQAEIEAVAGLLELKGIAARRWLGKNGELPVLAALLEKAQFFVGNDTGTMHIAAAVGIPVVGIFGGGHFPRFIPLGDHSLGVVGELPCFGCGWACNFTTPPCIKMVGVKDVENAITTVLDNKAVDMNLLEVQLPMSDVITIATSIAPRNIEIQAEAISSWLKLGLNVISVNTREEIDLLQRSFPGVSFAQITRNALSLTGKPYVFFDDILKILAATASNICGIINSDIILTANNAIYNFLNSNARQSFIYGSRVDVTSLEALNGKPYAHGFDYFFFDKSIIKFYPKSDYCLGAPWWDYWAPLIPIINGIPVKKLISPIAVHVKHTIQWSNDCHNYFGQRLANFLLNLDKFVLAGDDFTSELMSILKKNNSLLLSEVINIYIDTNSQDLHINDEELNKATISVSQYSSIKDLMNRYRIFYVHSEATLAAKLEEINDLRQRNEATEVDRTARLDVIHELQSQLEESERDRAARLEVIHDLQRNLKESEADRAARLAVILDIEKKWQQTEADRIVLMQKVDDLEGSYIIALKETDALKDSLHKTEAEAREKTSQIVSLTRDSDEKDELISDRDQKIKALQGNIEELKSSLSWKITDPVRRIADFLKK
jgi:ADP-heptose:LPS heptosyltransferase